MNDKDDTEPIRHQLGKLVLGVLAGFVATKVVELVYDAIVESRNKESIEIEAIEDNI